MKARSYGKLGLFAVLGTLAAIAAAAVAGVAALTEDTVTFTSYFNESVEGLNEGAPVKFRGVTVGHVASIDVAPDGYHVAVQSELIVEQSEHISGRADGRAEVVCAQLVNKGLTGLKLVQLDRFDPATCGSVDDLPFEPDGWVIPVARSMLNDLTLALKGVAESAPSIASGLDQLVQRLDVLAGDIQDEQLPMRAGALLDEGQATLTELRAALRDLDAPALSRESRVALRQMRQAAASVEQLSKQVQASDGLVASMQRSTNALGDLALDLQRDGDVQSTLDELSRAARAVQRLASALERDSDMLVKGRAEVEP